MPEIKNDGALRVRVYDILCRAIEDGIDLGWHQAHEHTDTPTEEAFKEILFRTIIDEVLEVFDVDEGRGELSDDEY